ncbi:MAG: hypothetical protein RLZZ292_1416 [Bacteroidota bacterium]|jgi:hypothetical protein
MITNIYLFLKKREKICGNKKGIFGRKSSFFGYKIAVPSWLSEVFPKKEKQKSTPFYNFVLHLRLESSKKYIIYEYLNVR